MTNFIKTAATLDNIDDIRKEIDELISKIYHGNRRANDIIFQGLRDINDLKLHITAINNQSDKIIEVIKKEILEQS